MNIAQREVTCGTILASRMALMRAGKTPAFIIALWYSRNSVSELSMLTARSLSAVLKLLRSRARSSRASAHPPGLDESSSQPNERCLRSMHGRALSRRVITLCDVRAHVHPALIKELIHSSTSHHRHGKEQMSRPLKCECPSLLHCQISSIKRAC